jgi:hypothetical protein
VSATLIDRLVVARAAWLEVEEATAETCDPEAIEHAAIAGLAMRHLAVRADELGGDGLAELVELELYDVDELERELYGVSGEAAA